MLKVGHTPAHHVTGRGELAAAVTIDTGGKLSHNVRLVKPGKHKVGDVSLKRVGNARRVPTAACLGADLLSPGQSELIASMRRRYPELLDEQFVAEGRDAWLS